MLVITGFFDKETFFPDSPVSIPQKKKVIVTIEEDTGKNKLNHFSAMSLETKGFKFNREEANE
jgi:hypothetical protein